MTHYLYPQNLKASANMWFWSLKDFAILGIAALLSIVILVELRFLLPAAATLDGTISAGESLLIDSLTKTITLTKADGTKENWFDKRNRDSYIFQEIPPGQNTVVWNDYFGFDLTIIEKRSEPKWI